MPADPQMCSFCRSGTEEGMKMKKSVSIRFISIVSLIIILWMGALAGAVITSTGKAQSEQADAFVSILKTIQSNEELLLRDSLLEKGESTIRLLKQTSAGMISNYDDEMLNSLARSTTQDKDIAYVVFYDTEGKPLTQEATETDNDGKNIETLKEEIVFEKEPVGSVELGLDFSVVQTNKEELHNRIEERIAEANQALGNVKNYMAKLIALGCLSGVILLAFSIYLVLSRVVIRPIKETTLMIKDIAEGKGDLTKRLDVKSENEIGELAKWFNIFIENMRNIIREVLLNAGQLNDSSGSLTSISEHMSNGAEETSLKAQTVSAASEEMSANIVSVASVIEQAATNMNMVATAAEEMTSTINEIAQNTEKATGITNRAVDQAANASQQMDELGNAAQEIGKVIETITEISEQVNLLALNATIEAARAGEAGKGFAVVANEIKELARQTADATGEISQRVEGIQGSTENTVTEINNITKVVNEVNEIVSTIATAVEEQSVTTREIAGNVNQASTGINEVNENVAQSSRVSSDIAGEIAQVNQSANEMSNSSSQVNLSAEELSKVAGQLNEMVSRFKV